MRKILSYMVLLLGGAAACWGQAQVGQSSIWVDGQDVGGHGITNGAQGVNFTAPLFVNSNAVLTNLPPCSIPSLQQVTTVGNTTTDPIEIGGGLTVNSIPVVDVAGMLFSGGNPVSTNLTASIPGVVTNHQPSVNFGTNLMVNGNPVMTNSSAGASTLQQVTDLGATTTNKITISMAASSGDVDGLLLPSQNNIHGNGISIGGNRLHTSGDGSGLYLDIGNNGNFNINGLNSAPLIHMDSNSSAIGIRTNVSGTYPVAIHGNTYSDSDFTLEGMIYMHGDATTDDSWRQGYSAALTSVVVQVRVSGVWTNAVVFVRP